METSLEGPSQPPLSCGKPKYIVVLLHAAEFNADELIGLSLDWAPTLGKAEFLAPRAPWHNDAGGSGHWKEAETGYTLSAERLNDYLDAALARRKLAPDQLALVGFAEGAELALRTALARERAIGAVVAISTRPDGLAVPGDIASAKPAVLLVEASLDPASAPSSPAPAETVLQELGIEVKSISRRGDYFGLDDDGIAEVADFLHRYLVDGGEDDDHDH